MKTKTTTGFSIDEDLLEILKDAATKKRMSASALVCQLIEENLKNKKGKK